MKSGYCNCIKGSKNFSVTKFRIVQTCSDGICENCGHYTLRSPKTVNHVSTGKPRGKKGLDESVKEEIRALVKDGVMGKVIAKKLGISPSTVSEVKNGR